MHNTYILAQTKRQAVRHARKHQITPFVFVDTLTDLRGFSAVRPGDVSIELVPGYRAHRNYKELKAALYSRGVNVE